MEVLDGLFPSVGGALQALNGSSPRFLQENLFGGDFLKSAGALNFSGEVGDQGTISPDCLSPQNPRLHENQNLVQFVSKALEDPAFFSVLKNTLMSSSSSASLYQVQQAFIKVTCVVMLIIPSSKGLDILQSGKSAPNVPESLMNLQVLIRFGFRRLLNSPDPGGKQAVLVQNTELETFLMYNPPTHIRQKVFEVLMWAEPASTLETWSSAQT